MIFFPEDGIAVLNGVSPHLFKGCRRVMWWRVCLCLPPHFAHFSGSGVHLVRRRRLPRFEEGHPRPSVRLPAADLVCPRKNRGHLPRGNVQGRAGTEGVCVCVSVRLRLRAATAPTSALIHGQACRPQKKNLQTLEPTLVSQLYNFIGKGT